MIIKNCALIKLEQLATLAMKCNPLNEDDYQLLLEITSHYSNIEIYNFSKKRKILPFIAKLMQKSNSDLGFWNEILNKFETRSLKIVDILNNLFEKFRENGVTKIFVYENFGAVLSTSSDLGCFASGDVDMFADFKQKEDIVSVLIDLGFVPKKLNTLSEVVKIEFQNDNVLENGFGINIMWKPMSRLKLPLDINLSEIFDWNSLYTYKNTSILLPPDDILMYLCILHVSIHGYHRSPDIRLYNDIERLSLKNINWKKIFKYAEMNNTLVRVATTLLISDFLFNTPVPKGIIDDLYRKYPNIKILLNKVFDKNYKILKNDPRNFNILLIEIYSFDKNILNAIFSILFPSNIWIKEHYRKDNFFSGYFLHLLNLMK